MAVSLFSLLPCASSTLCSSSLVATPRAPTMAAAARPPLLLLPAVTLQQQQQQQQQLASAAGRGSEPATARQTLTLPRALAPASRLGAEGGVTAHAPTAARSSDRAALCPCVGSRDAAALVVSLPDGSAVAQFGGGLEEEEEEGRQSGRDEGVAATGWDQSGGLKPFPGCGCGYEADDDSEGESEGRRCGDAGEGREMAGEGRGMAWGMMSATAVSAALGVLVGRRQALLFAGAALAAMVGPAVVPTAGNQALAVVPVVLKKLTYRACDNPFTVGPGSSLYKAKCFRITGVALNTSGRTVYNADVFGFVLDAYGEPAMPNRGRLASIAEIPVGESQFEIEVVVPASEALPLTLKNFRATGFHDAVNRTGNPYDLGDDGEEEF